MASVSIVILNFNGKKFLEQFLPTVIKHSQGHQVVVADNGSKDDSVEFLKTCHPEVRLIVFDKNHGFCGGYNKALQQLESDIFVLLNSDVEVTENWIEPIIKLFDNDPMAAAVQPKLLDYNRRDHFEYAGGAGGFIDVFGYPFCRGRIFDTIEKDSGQYNDSREIFWATGACMFVRGVLYKKYGGLDEDFFAHMEEIDLCWRMKKDGYKVVSCADSVAYHVGGGTLTYSNPRKTYLNFRNSIYVLIKNLHSADLAWKLPFRFAIDQVAVLKFLLTGDFKDALMVWKAHLSVFRSFRKTFDKRTASSVRLKALSGVYQGFLLFRYHIVRRKKFSNL